MDRSERKAAVSAYKERKPVAGVYAIRCATTDGQWVGAPIFPRAAGKTPKTELVEWTA